MKVPAIIIAVIALAAYAVYAVHFKPVAVATEIRPDNQVEEVSISREVDKGPQDVVCRSGGVVYYEHKNVLFYTAMINGYLYEVDTKEKIIVPMKDCMFRPHKK